MGAALKGYSNLTSYNNDLCVTYLQMKKTVNADATKPVIENKTGQDRTPRLKKKMMKTREIKTDGRKLGVKSRWTPKSQQNRRRQNETAMWCEGVGDDQRLPPQECEGMRGSMV